MELRCRKRITFSGFTNAEIEKMEQLFEDGREKSFNPDYCKKLARRFNRSKGRAGKPILKWTEIENWFQKRQQQNHSPDTLADNPTELLVAPETCPLDKAVENSLLPKRDLESGEKFEIPSDKVYEAKSSTDDAWYDVENFFGHRVLGSGEVEVLVRYLGFGPADDEWVNVKQALRERSISLENSECNLVKVGESVLCFQERKGQAKYYEAHVLKIEERLHDIRGCRCIFTIQYDHDKAQERVRLNSLCFRPCILRPLGKNVKKE